MKIVQDPRTLIEQEQRAREAVEKTIRERGAAPRCDVCGAVQGWEECRTITHAEKRGAAEERARIVAAMRRWADEAPADPHGVEAAVARSFADRIERGEHEGGGA